MSTPNSYDDSMRAHDKAVKDWFEGLRVDYGNMEGKLTAERNDTPIIRTFATPQRSFATIVDLLVSSNWVTGSTADAMRKAAGDFSVLPLPLITIERDEPNPDSELSGAPKTFRQQMFDQITQKFVDFPWPGHYKTDYRVTVWQNKKYTDAFVREWLYSRLGNKGASHNECFIPVTHAAPFGTWIQSFKFNGSSNLSDLEGESQRFMRYEYTFTLRTWIFKIPPPGMTPLDRIGRIYESISQVPPMSLEEQGSVDTTSMNMFLIPYRDDSIPTLWPKAGNATVQRAAIKPAGALNPAGLTLSVTDTDDTVELMSRPILIKDGHAILSVALEYRATADVTLTVLETNPSDGTTILVHTLTLPATSKWKKVHFFTVLKQPIFTIQVEGLSGFATVDLYNVDVRHVNNQVSVTPPAVVVGASFTDFIWTSLASEPYLIIGVLDNSVAASGSVQASDSYPTPAFSSSQSIDSTINDGFAFLIQPNASSVALKIPNDLVIASTRLQRYDGAYKGHEI